MLNTRIKLISALLLVLAVAVALTLALSPAPRALAQSGGAYDLTWNSFDGGGATFSTGGAYSLGGTIGQVDAGAMSGGTYSLSGGFWVDILLGSRTFLPVILR